MIQRTLATLFLVWGKTARYVAPIQCYGSVNHNSDIKVHYLGLSLRDIPLLFDFYFAAWEILYQCQFVGKLEIDVGDFFASLIAGFAETPKGHRNVLVSFEHPTLRKAARNEFLRERGSISLFLAKNTYMTYQHYACERIVNYDYVCASGPHLEELFRRKGARVAAFFPSGSFDVHQWLDTARDELAQQKTCADQRGESKTVVVLSPGICEHTYSSEVRLVKLALEIAALPNVTVVFRRKPGQAVEGFTSFYEDAFINSAVQLPDTGCSLGSYLHVADLFVTSISSSAADLCAAGGKVFFVDFQRVPDCYLPWERFPEFVLSEERALEMIGAALLDPLNLELPQQSQLRAYLSYQHENFESYRRSLVDNIEQLLHSLGEPLGEEK
jgi:hypothetical protein